MRRISAGDCRGGRGGVSHEYTLYNLRVKITVKLFGLEADVAGRRQIDLPLPGDATDVAAIRVALGAAVPGLLPRLPGCRWAVNCEFVGEDHRVKAGDEVALIGSVSGG